MTNSAFRRVPNALALAAVMLVAATLLVACGDRGGTEGAPAPGDTAVAKVDGKTVWASDVKREAVAQGLIGEGEPLDVSSDLCCCFFLVLWL